MFTDKISYMVCLIVQNIVTKAIEKRKNTGEAWMLHYIAEESSWGNAEFSITPDLLETLVVNAIRAGKKFAAIESLPQGKANDLYITFDDGDQGVYHYVLPICKKYQIPFAVFVTTDYIGKKGYLSKTELLELGKEPLCTIGAHSLSHPRLKMLKREEIHKELELSREILEDWLNKKISYLAYPYGGFQEVDMRTIRIAQKSGYRMAFSTLHTHTTNYPMARFIEPRKNINEEVARRLVDEYSNCAI